jgi:hypothetical protein
VWFVGVQENIVLLQLRAMKSSRKRLANEAEMRAEGHKFLATIYSDKM